MPAVPTPARSSDAEKRQVAPLDGEPDAAAGLDDLLDGFQRCGEREEDEGESVCLHEWLLFPRASETATPTARLLMAMPFSFLLLSISSLLVCRAKKCQQMAIASNAKS